MNALSTVALLAIPLVVNSENVQWYQTCESNGDRLSKQNDLAFSKKRGRSDGEMFRVVVDTSVNHQKILGFGGALTQSSATVYKALPKHLQKEIVEAYYGPNGIGYTTGRLPIHSCDFSVDMYTFDDIAGDTSLENFDTEVKYDQNLSLPMIHDVLDMKPDLLLFGSPWSPPAWMKDNSKCVVLW